MNVTPQHLPPTPGYPAHRKFTPLRAAVIAALACSATACHDNKPEPVPEASQPVKQEKKIIRPRPPQKQTRQTPRPLSPATTIPNTFPVAPGQIVDDIEFDGEIAIEPFGRGSGGITPLPSPNTNRGTIIEIGADTPPNEP